MTIKKICRKAGYLINHLTSMTANLASHGKVIKVNKGDKITITIKKAKK